MRLDLLILDQDASNSAVTQRGVEIEVEAHRRRKYDLRSIRQSESTHSQCRQGDPELILARVKRSVFQVRVNYGVRQAILVQLHLSNVDILHQAVINVEELLATDSAYHQGRSTRFVTDGAVQRFSQLAEVEYYAHLADG